MMFSLFDEQDIHLMRQLCWVYLLSWVIDFSAVDLAYGAVLCFQCGDYVYDQEFAAVAREHRMKAAKSLGMPAIYHSWEPSRREMDLLRRNPRRRKLVKNTTIGEIWFEAFSHWMQ